MVGESEHYGAIDPFSSQWGTGLPGACSLGMGLIPGADPYIAGLVARHSLENSLRYGDAGARGTLDGNL
jgi:hypothetical protein